MKQKLLNSLRLRLCLLVAFVLCAGGNAWGQNDVTVEIASLGTRTWTNNSINVEPITISYETNGGSTPTKSSAQFRWKTNNIITVSTSSGTLKSILFKTNSTATYGPKNLSYNSSAITTSGTSYTWNAPSGITSADFLVTSEARLTEFDVTYTPGPTYRITAASNNTDYGTVSLSNSTITASPETGYQVSTSTPYTVSSGTASVSQNGNVFTVTPSSDCTVTINFEEIPKYCVTYDANGGTGTMTDSNSPYYDGTTVTVLGNTFTRDNYIFSKWNTAADGNGTNYDEDDTFTINANTTLYAQWIPTHTATFSVSGTTSTATVAEGAAITFPSNPDDINGMKFMGWYDNEYSHATDAPAYVTSATMGSSNITYYAVFARGTVVESDNVSDAVLEQTLQHSSWIPAGGTTSSKTEYTLFGNGAYVESSPFDLSKLMKIKVFGGTYGGADTYKYGTITDGANKWLDFELSGTGNAKEHSFTGGSALSGTKALRIGSICGNGSGSGLRISKVEIYVKGTHTEYINYCTTVDMRPIPEITMADVEMAWGDTDKSVAPSATVGGSEYTGSFTYESSSTNLTIASDGKLACNVPGTYTVTASIAATVNNQAAEKTCNVIVNKQNITITFANAEVEKTISDTSSDNKHNQTATVAPAAYDGTISYTVSGDGASIEGSEVTYTKSGTVTVTATASTTDLYNGNSTTYALKLSHANIAQIKVLTSDATECAFEANLTDAVVTYVKDNFAYIHDATADVMVNVANHGLKARDKINGKVTGTVKASNQIDVLIALDKSAATVTENCEIPDAEVKTLAEIKNAGTTYDGKLVTVNTATVTGSIASDANSGASIKDGSQIESTDVSFNIYAPNTGITVNANEKGNFTGFVSIFNGTSYRLNLYDQSQFAKTHNAPTAQTLTFARDAVERDEETSALTEFTGQTVNGAHTTVTYSKTDASNIIGDFDTSTGVLTLNGTCGTATITATAAAENVEENGVTTPYTEATKSYTITVYPRHTLTFSVNGSTTPIRQDSHGASIDVPSPDEISGFKFMGWSTSTVSLTDEAPSMESLSSTITPESDATYYAVYAVEKTPATNGTYTLEYEEDEFTPGGYGNDVNVTANDGSSWVVRAYNNNGMQINSSKDASIKLPTCPYNIKTIVVTCSSNNNFTFGTTHKGSAVATPTNNTLDLTSGSYTTGYINPYSGANVITKIVVNYGNPATYENYCTTIPSYSVTVGTAGYTTYVTPDKVSMPSGVKAYIATQVNTNTIHLEEVSKVPANEPIILQAAAGTYNLLVYASDCDDVSDNILLASDGSVTGDGSTYWALAKFNGVVGFNVVGNGVTIPAGKAYLDLSGNNIKGFLSFDIEATDGIKAIENEQLTIDNENAIIYNLAGQRLQKMQRGINIVNGKKVLIK